MADTQTLPTVAPEYDLETLFDAGCHFGHQTKRWHPKMTEYIYGERNGVHIFDLEKTAEQLQKAYNYLYDLGKRGKTVIFVGTKRSAREIVQNAAVKAGAMHITSRWLGGLLTNWDQVSKSLKRMIELEEGLKTGKFDGYTKYEQNQLAKEAARLQRFFEGIRNLKQMPDAIFVVDPRKEDNVIAEATKMGVPVIALADSDSDPRPLEVVIPANDDAVKSIELIVNEMATAYAEGKKAKK